MSFRKKSIVLGTPASTGSEKSSPRLEKGLPSGTRPSPLDGRLTTSTGTSSLDQYLSGHTGFPMGSSLLLEESGTTDFSGVVLKYYAAEGLVQGHRVHVLGVGDAWRAELPGLSQLPHSSKSRNTSGSDDKMKIAWRYESLSRGGESTSSATDVASSGNAILPGDTYCHAFDLATRMDSRDVKGHLNVVRSTLPPGSNKSTPKTASPLQISIIALQEALTMSSPECIHRIVVPNLLSPASYGPSASRPSEVLQFLHALRALLRKYSTRLSVMVSLSTALYPRSTGLVRWMETLLDGVLELVPLQQPVHTQPGSKPDDAAQGMLKIHRLPISSEVGGGPGGRSFQENLSFKLSSSSGLLIRPYSLPPIGDTTEPQDAVASESKAQKLSF